MRKFPNKLRTVVRDETLVVFLRRSPDIVLSNLIQSLARLISILGRTHDRREGSQSSSLEQENILQLDLCRQNELLALGTERRDALGRRGAIY